MGCGKVSKAVIIPQTLEFKTGLFSNYNQTAHFPEDVADPQDFTEKRDNFSKNPQSYNLDENLGDLNGLKAKMDDNQTLNLVVVDPQSVKVKMDTPSNNNQVSIACENLVNNQASNLVLVSPQPLKDNINSSNKSNKPLSFYETHKKNIQKAQIIIEEEQSKKLTNNKKIMQLISHRLNQIAHYKQSFKGGTGLQGVQNFCQIWRNSKYLEKLSLDFKGYSVLAAKVLSSLSLGLNDLGSLNMLNLNLYSCAYVSDNDLESLYITLNHLCGLSILALNFGQCHNLSDDTLKYLSSGLKGMRSLVTLRLSFISWAHLSDKGIKILVSSLRNLPLLSTLSLNFSKCIQFDDRALQSLYQGLKYISALSSLDLKFASNKSLSPDAINNFLSNLGSLTGISSLSLDFSDILDSDQYYNSKMLENLCQMLKQLTSLSALNLGINNNFCIDYKGITNIFASLSELIHFSSLTMQLRSMDFKYFNENLDDLRLDLSMQRLKSLSYLHLDFSFCMTIGNKGIETFASYLRELSGLSSLALNFNYCQSISNQGIKILCNALKELTSLKLLTLDFSNCSKIEIEVMEDLYTCLSHLTLLSDLILRFDNWNRDRQLKEDFESKLKKINPLLKIA